MYGRAVEEQFLNHTTRLRSGDLNETPCADPHAGCYGGWGEKPPGYPIRLFIVCLSKVAQNGATLTQRWELLQVMRELLRGNGL